MVTDTQPKVVWSRTVDPTHEEHIVYRTRVANCDLIVSKMRSTGRYLWEVWRDGEQIGGAMVRTLNVAQSIASDLARKEAAVPRPSYVGYTPAEAAYVDQTDRLYPGE